MIYIGSGEGWYCPPGPYNSLEIQDYCKEFLFKGWIFVETDFIIFTSIL